MVRESVAALAVDDKTTSASGPTCRDTNCHVLRPIELIGKGQSYRGLPSLDDDSLTIRCDSKKRSKFSNRKISTEERLTVRILRVNGVNTNGSDIKVVLLLTIHECTLKMIVENFIIALNLRNSNFLCGTFWLIPTRKSSCYVNKFLITKTTLFSYISVL